MTPIALTIAGSDSSGGAGIQADLKAFAAHGVYGASAIAALTAQNTQGVRDVMTVPPDFVCAQIGAVFDDLDVKAVKIGMLGEADVIEAVADALETHKARRIVLDPVMVATSGDMLLAPEAVGALRERLLPMADLITPNLAEAAALLGEEQADDLVRLEDQAVRLKALGAIAVLITGGDADGAESVDMLCDRAGVMRLAAPRAPTRNTHGTGCTLSAAIAANLAKGCNLRDAVRLAKDYITGAIKAADALGVGKGRGPVDHFWRW